MNLASAVDHLKSGNVLIYPTETLYGMGVDAHNEQAIRKLFELKKRSLSKPVPVLLPNIRMLDELCDGVSDQAKIFMDAFWPGPLTIVLSSTAFPKGVGTNGKVGFRISAHPLTQAILSYFRKCITATSANISDEPTPSDPNLFFKIFPKDSFMLIQDEKPMKPSKPSTVIDCTEENYKIIREGAISKAELEKALARGK